MKAPDHSRALQHYSAMAAQAAHDADLGPFLHHPLDPRTEPDDDELGLRYCIEEAQNLLGRAERALAAGDYEACEDLMKSAARELAV